MIKQVLKSADFWKLKGLKNVHIDFSESLTAIMGVNGSGKTTVIHALACAFSPEENGYNYKFSYFFPPNTDSRWAGSNFSLLFEGEDGRQIEKKYLKQKDRWAPRYASQPKRDIYYIGIESCLPEVEKNYSSGSISYKSTILNEKSNVEIIKEAAQILNKNYEYLIDNKYKAKTLIGVQLESGLKYSSLSMGAGEQRVIKILKILRKATAYSLVLIDEIDLLLHVSSLKKLIKKIYFIAKSKNIQIIFTTHSLEMMNLSDYVKVQYLDHYNPSEEKTLVYDRITSDLIYALTEKKSIPHTIYCEDNFAKAIIETILIEEGLKKIIDVVTFGAIENAFTLAASWFISKNEIIKNNLIVIDGDKYTTEAEKLGQIKKKITGTEANIGDKQENAVKCITQFILPESTSPEKYFHSLIIKHIPEDNELYKIANGIEAVENSHDWMNKICEQANMRIDTIVSIVIREIYNTDDFQIYCKNILSWLKNIVKNEDSKSNKEKIATTV